MRCGLLVSRRRLLTITKIMKPYYGTLSDSNLMLNICLIDTYYELMAWVTTVRTYSVCTPD